MTAKEALAEWVGGLSEAEAAAYLEKVQPRTDEATRIAEGPARAARLRAMFARWEAEGPAMDEAQWEEFRDALESDRLSDRPLFS